MSSRKSLERVKCEPVLEGLEVCLGKEAEKAIPAGRTLKAKEV